MHVKRAPKVVLSVKEAIQQFLVGTLAVLDSLLMRAGIALGGCIKAET